MASRRDLFQSYQFMVQRVISGVVLRETDPIQSPLRKMIGSGFASVMIGVVALAGTALIGIFWPSGNTTWQDGGAVIIEEDTGATFAWLPDADGVQTLYPTANFASAALLVGTTKVVEVSHASLLEAPRGPRLGILDAPDSIPQPDLMLQSGWSLCSLPLEDVDGAFVPNTGLVVGQNPSEGNEIEEQAALVQDVTEGTLHLIWNGHQFPISNAGTDESAVLEALILQGVTPINVGTAWLNGVPRGDVLRPNAVAGRGEVSTAISDGIVGQIRTNEAGGRTQYYQVGATQIIEITEVQARILLAEPGIEVAYEGRRVAEFPLQPAEAADAPRVDLDAPSATDPPASVPAPAETINPDPTICAYFDDDAPTPVISVDAKVEGVENANPTQQQTESGTVLADRVLVESGHAAIVQEQPSNGSTSGVRYLVTDEGRRYLLPSSEVAAILGYGSIQPVQLPSSLIARIPAGSALDPVEAQRPVS